MSRCPGRSAGRRNRRGLPLVAVVHLHEFDVDLALVDFAFPPGRGIVAPIGRPFPLISEPVTFVGAQITLISDVVAPIHHTFAMVQGVFPVIHSAFAARKPRRLVAERQPVDGKLSGPLLQVDRSLINVRIAGIDERLLLGQQLRPLEQLIIRLRVPAHAAILRPKPPAENARALPVVVPGEGSRRTGQMSAEISLPAWFLSRTVIGRARPLRRCRASMIGPSP